MDTDQAPSKDASGRNDHPQDRERTQQAAQANPAGTVNGVTEGDDGQGMVGSAGEDPGQEGKKKKKKKKKKGNTPEGEGAVGVEADAAGAQAAQSFPEANLDGDGNGARRASLHPAETQHPTDGVAAISKSALKRKKKKQKALQKV